MDGNICSISWLPSRNPLLVFLHTTTTQFHRHFLP
ncbi:hypothetical protein CsSME_00049903 [Camellia sinensis var. sinensis]